VFVLAVIGLFTRPWHPTLALHQLHLLGLAGLVVLGTFFIYYDHPRFYVVALAILCIWASAGLAALTRWGRAAGRAWGWRDRLAAGFGTLIGIVTFAALVAGPALAAKRLFQRGHAEQAIRMAGEWLRDNAAGPVRLLNSSTPLAFHAGAAHFWLPYCDEPTALRYIEQKQITHVVVRTADRSAVPYLDKWLGSGPPLAQAKVVYGFDMPGESIKIYATGR
jgi:hypothetical protein